MDLNVNKESIPLTKIAVDGFIEEKVDLDIIIPDYCASAGKILKCDISPVITSKSIENDKINVQGICNVVVIYTDENSGVIRSISENCEFNQSFPLKESLENYKVKLKLRPTNVVCRLQNPRRISIKSMIGIAIKVLGNYEQNMITDFDDKDIETMFENVRYSAYINSGSSDIHINGELQTRNSVTEIIKSNCYINVSDIKVIKDKVIVKGECKVNILYTFGDDICDVKNDFTVIPFSDVIDVVGADEGQTCDCSSEVISVRCNVGNVSEQNVITLEIDATVNVGVYQNSEIKILRDIYSGCNELSVSTETVSFESLEKFMKFDSIVKESIEFELSDVTVDEICVKPLIKNITCADSNLIVEGDVNVSASLHNDFEYKMCEKTYQFKISQPLAIEYTKLRCEANVVCSDINYTMPSDENLDFECVLSFDILVFSKKNINVISDVEIESRKEKSENSKIYLYYADKGEKLWDIAKKYCSSVDAIKRDNSIDGDCLDKNCMLLICEK